jgi:hypothetical protein
MSATSARRPLPALAFLLVLSILTAIVWWRVLHRPDAASHAAVAPAPVATCVPKSKLIALPAAKAVHVTVYNGAAKYQLASDISTQLRSRGFVVGTPGDANPLTTVGEIRYGSTGRAAAVLLGFYVPGARLVPLKRAGATLDLVLGSKFVALAPAATVAKAVAGAKKAC